VGELLPLFGQILAQIARNIGVSIVTQTGVNAILGIFGGSNSPVDMVLVQSDVVITEQTVQNGTYGLPAIQSLINTNDTLILNALSTILTAVSPVSLPPTPPAGYGGADPSTIATYVWDYPITTGLGGTTGQQIQGIGAAAYNWGNYALKQILGAPFFWLGVSWSNSSIDPSSITQPTPILANILSTDTVLSWLTRESPTFSWSDTIVPDFIAAFVSSPTALWICTFTVPEFDAIKAQLFPGSGATVPPVWPGLANVTLGTPVAIATGVTISTPMDGVLIDITGVPSKQGYFSFDTAISWRNVGALAFVSDNGDEEFPQTLGFQNAVYTPKSLSTAAGVVLRALDGVTGTITPWVIS